MAALNSAGMARRATHGPSNDNSQSPNVSFATISSYQPPINNPAMNQPPQSHPSLPTPTHPQHPTPQQQQQQRQRQSFLQGLSAFMSRGGNPLPPTVTGIAVPNWDGNSTHWKALEPGTELGTFKLAGKNIDLWKLFNLVAQAGGSVKVSHPPTLFFDVK
jgi:SWI/SNF chromatin-remodeling complex subunit SWI1